MRLPPLPLSWLRTGTDLSPATPLKLRGVQTASCDPGWRVAEGTGRMTKSHASRHGQVIGGWRRHVICVCVSRVCQRASFPSLSNESLFPRHAFVQGGLAQTRFSMSASPRIPQVKPLRDRRVPDAMARYNAFPRVAQTLFRGV